MSVSAREGRVLHSGKSGRSDRCPEAAESVCFRPDDPYRSHPDRRSRMSFRPHRGPMAARLPMTDTPRHALRVFGPLGIKRAVINDCPA